MKTQPDQPRRTLAQRLPIMQGILPVDRTTISGEIIAGLTLAALAIPEVMGYATLAGMSIRFHADPANRPTSSLQGG